MNDLELAIKRANKALSKLGVPPLSFPSWAHSYLNKLDAEPCAECGQAKRHSINCPVFAAFQPDTKWWDEYDAKYKARQLQDAELLKTVRPIHEEWISPDAERYIADGKGKLWCIWNDRVIEQSEAAGYLREPARRNAGKEDVLELALLGAKVGMDGESIHARLVRYAQPFGVVSWYAIGQVTRLLVDYEKIQSATKKSEQQADRFKTATEKRARKHFDNRSR